MPYSVLLVDDEKYALKNLEHIINWTELDYEICAAVSGGRDALSYIKKSQPDLIVSDIHMYDMDGLEMLEEIRKTGGKTAVIFVSAYDKFEYAQKAITLGALEYLLKPVSADKLKETLERIKPILKNNITKFEKENNYVIDRIIKKIKSDCGGKHVLSEYAAQYKLTPNYLGNLFKKVTGMSFISYLLKVRMERAAFLMKNTDKSLEEIGAECGYDDYFHFNKMFKKIMGVPPATFRRSASAETEKREDDDNA